MFVWVLCVAVLGQHVAVGIDPGEMEDDRQSRTFAEIRR